MTSGRNGLLFVLSGPSGSGKTTLARRLLERHGGTERRLQLSISATTRPPRLGEMNGSDYHFMTEPHFSRMASRGELLEMAEVYGHRYGTPRAFVEDRIGLGVDVLLVLDTNGRRQLARTHAADLVSFFVLPPSDEELERRLRGRGQDDEATIARRLQSARQEIARADEYNHVIVNRDVTMTLDALNFILRGERLLRAYSAPPLGWQPQDTPWG